MVDDPATWGSPPSSPMPPVPLPLVAPSAWTVRRFATIDSTNRWLLDEARSGAPSGLVAVADHQDAGRGRRGRTWDDEPGASLLVSVLVRPPLPVERVPVVTMAAGVAVAEAVRATSGVVAGLKWPNDLVVGDRKLAGLLTEVDLGSGGVPPAVVVGIGCNVSQTVFPQELAATATSLWIETGTTSGDPTAARDALLTVLLDRLTHHLDALDAVPAAYRERLATSGRSVRVDLGETVLEGVAIGVDDAGRLLVDVGRDEPVVVAAGDVVHLRHPGGPVPGAGSPD